jgi:hypothetical protein
MCKIAPFAATLSVNVSVYTLVLISLDRFLHLVYPFKSNLKTNQIYIILAILWTFSLLLSLIKLINFKTYYIDINEDVMICGPVDYNIHKIETITLIIIQYVIPFIIISFTYSYIACRICLIATSDLSARIQNKKKNKVLFINYIILSDFNYWLLFAYKQVLKMVLILVVFFFIFWTPLQLFNFVNVVYPDSV